MPMERVEIESALDSGHLEICMPNKRWWKVRRNGRTKLWKKEPHRFEIPIKAGWRTTGRITHENYQDRCWRVSHTDG